MCSIRMHNVSSVTALFSDKANIFAVPICLERRDVGAERQWTCIFACRLVGAKF